MRAKSIFIRAFVVVFSVVLLLLPGLSMVAVRWSDINLVVAIVAIIVAALIGIGLPKFRWIGAAVASLLIAVPPYPYWLNWSEVHGWHLHFFSDVNLDRFSAAIFSLLFFGAMLLFSAIFWALPSKERQL